MIDGEDGYFLQKYNFHFAILLHRKKASEFDSSAVLSAYFNTRNSSLQIRAGILNNYH